MTSLVHVAPNEDRISTLANAFELRLVGESNHRAGVFAAVLRQLSGVLSPCPRRDLLSAAEDALAGCVEDGQDELLEEMLEDLIVGGDIVEQPALIEGRGDNPVFIFPCQPGFLRMGSRLHIVGVAPDDASFLPRAVAERIWTEGGLRYVTGPDEDLEEISTLLGRIGLREISMDAWAATAPSRTP